MEADDVVIIGAGHNALVCAGYLLKAGYSVLTWFKSAEPRLNHHLAGLFGVSSKFEVTAVCLSQLV